MDTIPILVGSKSSYSLEDVVSAAELTDTATQRELERLAADIKSLIDSSASDRQAAASSARQAKSSEDAAKSSASAARWSADVAKTSESNAASSADRAEQARSDTSAVMSQTNELMTRAQQAATDAGGSASVAKQSEKNAASSASTAKSHADRAGRIADSTSWSGDRLTVNGKTSPSLTGPKGDRGPKGQDGEVKFESLTQAQKETLRGPAGVVISETEPADKNVVWIQPGGEKFEILGNSYKVRTVAEAEAASQFLPKGFYIDVIDAKATYEVV